MSLASHQAKVPAPAERYFTSVGVPTHIFGTHPVIAKVFTPEVGWRSYPLKKRVSISALRRLRSEGATQVQLVAGGHAADFTITELLSTRSTQPRKLTEGWGASTSLTSSSDIKRTAVDITAGCARLAMEMKRTEAIRADAAAIAQSVELVENRSVHSAAVALVQALDDRLQSLTKQLATEQALLRFETRNQKEG